MARGKGSVGAALRELRLEAELSVNALARLAGLDPATLTRIENEDRTNVRFTTIAQIAVALGVPMEEIAVRAGLIRGKKMPARGPGLSIATAKDDLERLSALLERGQERVSKIKKLLGNH